ncbi:MAG: Ig-like domain-containing protein [Methanobacterium sp.]|nr:Ig-like domain-containing protein [Methanobacterium sp.]
MDIHTNKGFIGTDTFIYIASDGYGNFNTAAVTVIVHPFNPAPVSTNMTFDIETQNNLTGQLKATDQDDDDLTYKIIQYSTWNNKPLKQFKIHIST